MTLCNVKSIYKALVPNMSPKHTMQKRNGEQDVKIQLLTNQPCGTTEATMAGQSTERPKAVTKSVFIVSLGRPFSSASPGLPWIVPILISFPVCIQPHFSSILFRHDVFYEMNRECDFFFLLLFFLFFFFFLARNDAFCFALK